MVDPNTGFEFNLQLLASEKGYSDTKNGKEFLVGKMLKFDRHFCATSFLHLGFIANLQVNICSNMSKCGAGNAGCVLEDGVPFSQVGAERSLQYSSNGLLTLTYKGQLDKPTGSSADAHGTEVSAHTVLSALLMSLFSCHQENGTLSPLILCVIQTLTPAH